MVQALLSRTRWLVNRDCVKEIGTYCSDPQDSDFGFGYRPRLKRLIRLAMFASDPSRQFVRFAGACKVFQRFGQKPVTQSVRP
jgi:hypothetical protein